MISESCLLAMVLLQFVCVAALQYSSRHLPGCSDNDGLRGVAVAGRFVVVPCYAQPLLATLDLVNGQWTMRAQNATTVNTLLGLGFYGDLVYVSSFSLCTRAVFVSGTKIASYDVATQQWSAFATPQPPNLQVVGASVGLNEAVVVYGNGVYLVSASSSPWTWTFLFSARNNTYSSDPYYTAAISSGPVAVLYSSQHVLDIYNASSGLHKIVSVIAAAQGYFVLAAGNFVVFYAASASAIQLLNMHTATWMPFTLPVLNSDYAVATDGRHMFFAGGDTVSSSRYLSAVDVLDLQSLSWTSAELTVGRSFSSTYGAVSMAGLAMFVAGDTKAGGVNVVDIFVDCPEGCALLPYGCASCSAGRFTTSGLDCNNCSTGSYSHAASSACTICFPGAFSCLRNADLVFTGTFCPVVALPDPLPCPAGMTAQVFPRFSHCLVLLVC